jgi:hypothetical protein
METNGNVGKQRPSICAVWDFRANEELYESDILLNFMKNNCKKYVFQKEKGDTGYVHWQGRFSLMKKRTKSALMTLFNSIGIPNYLEPTANVNHQDDFFYALKEDTRLGDLFMDVIHEKRLGHGQVYIPRQFRGIQLYPWQQHILDSSDIFDFRVVDVLIDFKGNTGKTTVSGLADLLHGAIDMPILNDYKEIISLACNICMDTGNRSPKVFFFDMPRAVKKNSLNEFYSAIEQIKKGKLYDIRYHYKSFWIDSPRIWVFTNTEPDVELLSRDRWRFWTIDNETNDLIPYVLKQDKDIDISSIDTEINKIDLC